MGNTCRKSWYTYLVRDHPHIHGEYGFIQQHFAIVEGSPPHTWGIPKESLTNAGMDRITPTYMGNTDQTDRRKSSTGDHPHIHGEYVAVPNGALAASGSPPHTWGIHRLAFLFPAQTWITPTYMGNTSPRYLMMIRSKDHPHIHGEYACQALRSPKNTGSPPHTWGIQFSPVRPTISVRITPTYMGNTHIVPPKIKLCKDHPHIHGEYKITTRYLSRNCRITPTYMGNTSVLKLTACPKTGSPPHTWGILTSGKITPKGLWITPTYMGNTIAFDNPSGLK